MNGVNEQRQGYWSGHDNRSLLEAARDSGLDSYACLLHVLKTAPQMDLKQDVQKLLPWNVSLKK